MPYVITIGGILVAGGLIVLLAGLGIVEVSGKIGFKRSPDLPFRAKITAGIGAVVIIVGLTVTAVGVWPPKSTTTVQTTPPSPSTTTTTTNGAAAASTTVAG